MKTWIKTAAVYAVATAIVSAIVSQILNGEPELHRTVTFGVVFGITMATFLHWQEKKKTE
ncbi:MAG: hypothetical protein AAGF31_12655 [Planctomycetota bacterium]